jgi:hypothetical protein
MDYYQRWSEKLYVDQRESSDQDLRYRFSPRAALNPTLHANSVLRLGTCLR